MNVRSDHLSSTVLLGSNIEDCLEKSPLGAAVESKHAFAYYNSRIGIMNSETAVEELRQLRYIMSYGISFGCNLN